MSNRLIILIVLILLVVLGFVLFSGDNESVEPVIDDKEEDIKITELVANHFYNDGTHTIEGTITLPTPCHELSHNITVAKSLPEQVMVNFTIKESEGVCVQTIADKFYRISFQASKDAKILARLNGEPVKLTFSENFEGIVK